MEESSSGFLFLWKIDHIVAKIRIPLASPCDTVVYYCIFLEVLGRIKTERTYVTTQGGAAGRLVAATKKRSTSPVSTKH